MTVRTSVIRDRILAVLRDHGFLTTAQIAERCGWILEAELHNPSRPNAVVGFYHTFGEDHPSVRVVACDGTQCLLSRNLAHGQTVLRHLNAMEKKGILTKHKTPGVQACAWYINNPPRDDPTLEELWNLPAGRRNGA